MFRYLTSRTSAVLWVVAVVAIATVARPVCAQLATSPAAPATAAPPAYRASPASTVPSYRPGSTSPYSAYPISELDIIDSLSDSVAPAGLGSLFSFDDDEEEETVVIRDLKELPAELLEGLKQLPKAQREKIEAAVRERGLKLPKLVVNPAADVEEADPARQEAAQLLARFSELKALPRSTSDVLAARAEQMRKQATAGASAKKLLEPISLAELLGGGSALDFTGFQGRIIAGDWAGLQKELETMPPEVADGIYSRMLNLLAATNGAMVPHEILDLADAAPKKLTRGQLSILGNMLKKSLATVDAPTRFLDRLGRGSRRLGGKDPELRFTAALLLLEAGLTDEVAKYLQPQQEALKRNDAEQLNAHGALLLQQAQQAETPEPLLVLGWELFQHVLRTADPKSSGYREAVGQVTMLLGRVPNKLSAPWLRQTYETNPPLGLLILSQIVGRLGNADDNNRGGNYDEGRLQALRSLKAAMQELAPAAKAEPAVWNAPLQLAAGEWCKQVAVLLKQEENNRRNSRSSYNNYGDSYPEAEPVDSEEAALAMSVVPDEACLAVVEPETAWQARKLIGELTARIHAERPCFATIKLFVDRDPQTARHLAESYLQHWAETLQQPQQYDQYQNYGMHSAYRGGGMMYYQQRHMPQGAVPLTRSRQVRNLAEMRTLLDKFAALGVKELDEETLVGVFTQCHSPAEVYRREDVESVFGAIDEQQPAVVATLVSAMRSNLAGQWRKPDLQEELHTNRTDAELAAEIARGYALAVDMLGPVVDHKAAPPEARLMLGNVYFDLAEFLYGQQADLKTYVAMRDRAFAQYRLAHEVYAQAVGEKKPTEFDASIYRQWFQSALGASDLAYLSRQDEPDRDQIDQIAAAIESLGPKVSAAHVGLFAKQASDGIGEVPAHLKPWFTREALRIVGEHPGARPLRQLADLYRDLLTEIELHLRVDGSGTVGREPFGAHLVIRGTTAVMREGQSFTMLLNQGYSYATSQQVNHKEKLEKEIREKLGEAFEVQQVRFHEPTVEPRSFGRDGWRELPLAYVVLKAKDPAIDRIPSVELDLEYSDGQGFVVLPINSPVELVDARSPPVSRPMAELKIKQVLDDRKLDKNVVRVEISASGKGLIPELDRLLQLAEMRGAAGATDFQIGEVVDHGITIGGLDTKSDKVRPQCERRWTIDLAPRAGAKPAEFAFPTATSADTELTFARFDDADLATVGPVVVLRNRPFSPQDWLWPAVGIVAGLALAAAVVLQVRRAKQRSTATVDKRYRRPSHVTPFSAIALLKQLVADPQLGFSAADRGDLSVAIRHLEDRYFARSETSPTPRETNGHVELESLLNVWLLKASKGAT